MAQRGRHPDLPGHRRLPGAIDAVSTLEDTNRELVRNVGQEAIRNFATWWMDLGATGWFNDPRMWREMERLKAIDEPLLQHPSAYRPEVAAVIDERAMLRLAAGSTAVTRPGIYEVRRRLAAWVLLTASTCSTTCWPAASMPGSSSCSTPGGYRPANGRHWQSGCAGPRSSGATPPATSTATMPSIEAMRQLTGFDIAPLSGRQGGWRRRPRPACALGCGSPLVRVNRCGRSSRQAGSRPGRSSPPIPTAWRRWRSGATATGRASSWEFPG